MRSLARTARFYRSTISPISLHRRSSAKFYKIHSNLIWFSVGVLIRRRHRRLQHILFCNTFLKYSLIVLCNRWRSLNWIELFRVYVQIVVIVRVYFLFGICLSSECVWQIVACRTNAARLSGHGSNNASVGKKKKKEKKQWANKWMQTKRVYILCHLTPRTLTADSGSSYT